MDAARCTLSRHNPSWAAGRGVLLLLALLILPGVSSAAELLRLRQGETPERTRLVLDLSDSTFEWQTTTEAEAVVLRLIGVHVGRTFAPIAQGVGRLKEARVVEKSRDEVLLLLQFRAPSSIKTFRLEAAGGAAERLVIDITGDSEGESGVPATSTDPTPEPRRRGPRVVVIDPGHGGHDPGAVAPGLQEKEICLDVARRLRNLLAGAPEAVAVLTRDQDVRVGLRQRMRFAEEADGDLFVSIHVNAARSRKAHGAEVFFLSLGAATDEASRELARLENEADPEYVVQEDADLQTLPFLVDLRQSDTLLRSSRVAEVVLDVFQERSLAEVRGVKQASFAVLKSFQIPSILVEVGFISSERDRTNLKSSAHRQELAEALAEGILRYFRQYAPRRADDSGS